jgi:hypothetical protein
MKLPTRGLALDVHEEVGSRRRQALARRRKPKYVQILSNTCIYGQYIFKYCFSV